MKDFLGFDVSEDDKELVRKEILSENKIRLGVGVAIVQKAHKKWFPQLKPTIQLNYWDRFATYLARDKGFSRNVIAQMDKVSDEIVDLLGNPNRSDEKEQRRGLVIGDVQSGKTANYSGIICKAVDAGFRTVILLTGTTNGLRRQTQMRLDEAFIGLDSAAINKRTDARIGVGKYNPSLNPQTVTSVDQDFSTRAAKQIATQLSQGGTSERPLLFVIKKNVTVLKNLYDWIRVFNQQNDQKIDNSVLLIDDESDYASINTNKKDNDPTKTNEYIVKILNLFRFSSYVGFTATPYANVFIDPEDDKALEKEADEHAENIFPKDYIYALDSPSNYIGARNIFPQNAEYHFMLRTIDDGEDYYPIRHKKDSNFSEMPPSLKDAVYTFMIANVVRDLRGDSSKHRSMMINVTRFVATQQDVKRSVESFVDEVKRSIKLYSSLDGDQPMKDNYIKHLYDIFMEEFYDCGFNWEEIKNNLANSVLPIQIFGAWGNGDSLNYDEWEDGLRAIVVGGQRLSRGLTLEGLMVSYLYRNSMAYDTLMQMGRWFGYRGNYDDLCRIWMSEPSQNWYSFICEATDELLSEIGSMRERKATPLEFGLKVRNDPDIPLIVTARNKMRTAQSAILNISLSGEVIETPFAWNDKTKNDILLSATRKFLVENHPKKYGAQYGITNISKDKILGFLDSIKDDIPPANNKFDPKAISQFIRQYKGSELDEWDILVATGESNTCDTFSDIVDTKRPLRKFDLQPNDRYIRFSCSKRRVGSPSDPRFNLSEEQIDLIKNIAQKDNLSSKDYLKVERNPLLMIYLTHLNKPTDEMQELVDFGNNPVIGFGIGIPNLSNVRTKFITYQINKIGQEYGILDQDGDYGDEDGEEDNNEE